MSTQQENVDPSMAWHSPGNKYFVRATPSDIRQLDDDELVKLHKHLRAMFNVYPKDWYTVEQTWILSGIRSFVERYGMAERGMVMTRRGKLRAP